jgi:single-stranded-DNA-specific exonuclease
VAIATITDSMPMTLDNIKYVYNGLQLLKDGYGSEAINYYKEYNNNTDLTPKDIAFGLGPQINSCGRMNNTLLALNYLFATDDDIEDLYNEISQMNDRRKNKTKKAIEIAEEMIDLDKETIILELDDVEGIAGIIASNLSSKYNKCTIIFSRAGDVLIGSARSDGHVDFLQTLKIIAESNDSIIKLGGHAGACGITIKADGMKELESSLEKFLSAIPKIKIEPVKTEIVVDDYITLSDVTKKNCDALRSLYFFTETNPVFAINDVVITKVKYSGNNPNNVCFDLKDNSGTLQTWTWGIGDMYRLLKEPKQVSLIAELDMKFGKPSLNIINIIPKREIEIC